MKHAKHLDSNDSGAKNGILGSVLSLRRRQAKHVLGSVWGTRATSVRTGGEVNDSLACVVVCFHYICTVTEEYR